MAGSNRHRLIRHLCFVILSSFKICHSSFFPETLNLKPSFARIVSI